MRQRQFNAAILRGLALLATFSLALSSASAIDMLREIRRDPETGEFVESTKNGELVLEKTDADVATFSYKSGDEKKTVEYSPENVLWIQLEGEPLETSKARVELQVGNYREALDALDEIEPGEVKSGTLVELQVLWIRCLALFGLSETEPPTPKPRGASSYRNESSPASVKATSSAKTYRQEAIVALSWFVSKGKNHYRYYEANALLAEALLARGREWEVQDAIKPWSELTKAKSETTRARGTVGLSEIALEQGSLDAAREEFSKAAALDADDPGSVEVVARAKLGLAKVAEAGGKYEDAIRILKETLASIPENAIQRRAVLYNALGEAYESADMPEDAILARLRVDLLYPTARSERIKALRALVPLWERVGRQDRADETRQILADRFDER
ncbi:MAG: hypothetical protein IJM30_04715 [Thermoguttaceae bacterium]|nr:hypothetical protein [Thermoguttaceae bacterium]